MIENEDIFVVYGFHVVPVQARRDPDSTPFPRYVVLGMGYVYLGQQAFRTFEEALEKAEETIYAEIQYLASIVSYYHEPEHVPEFWHERRAVLYPFSHYTEEFNTLCRLMVEQNKRNK